MKIIASRETAESESEIVCVRYEVEARKAEAAAPSLFIVSVKKKFRLLRANCKKGIANKARTAAAKH